MAGYLHIDLVIDLDMDLDMDLNLDLVDSAMNIGPQNYATQRSCVTNLPVAIYHGRLTDAR